MSEIVNGDEESPKRKRKVSRLGLQITSAILVSIGVALATAIIYGFAQGSLNSFWANVTDAQGSMIAACITLYAAALAAVLGPLIFTGQISDMQSAGEETLLIIEHQVQRLNEQLEHVRKVVRKTEESVEKPDAPGTFDAAKALLHLEGIREDATALAQRIVDKSAKWYSTKEKTKRKWAGHRPYYALLQELGFISEAQRDLFFAIADTRQRKIVDVTNAIVSKAEADLTQLRQLSENL